MAKAKVSKAVKAAKASRRKLDMKMAGEPIAPLIFMLVGGLFIFISGIVSLYLGTPQAINCTGCGNGIVGLFGQFNVFYGTMGVLAGILLMICASHTYDKDPIVVKIWSTIGFGATILSLFNFGGFFIGFFIALFGSVIGMMHPEYAITL